MNKVTAAAPRIVQIGDGLYAQVEDRSGGLPRGLPALLGALTVLRQWDVRMRGHRQACVVDDHRFVGWLWGTYAGKELRLNRCPFCGTVEVRDVSLDILPGVRAGTGGPRRRDAVLGWYSGKRALGRTYL